MLKPGAGQLPGSGKDGFTGQTPTSGKDGFSKPVTGQLPNTGHENVLKPGAGQLPGSGKDGFTGQIPSTGKDGFNRPGIGQPGPGHENVLKPGAGQIPNSGKDGFTGQFPTTGKDGFSKPNVGFENVLKPGTGQSNSGSGFENVLKPGAGQIPNSGKDGFTGQFPTTGKDGFSKPNVGFENVLKPGTGQVPSSGKDGFSVQVPAAGKDGFSKPNVGFETGLKPGNLESVLQPGISKDLFARPTADNQGALANLGRDNLLKAPTGPLTPPLPNQGLMSKLEIASEPLRTPVLPIKAQLEAAPPVRPPLAVPEPTPREPQPVMPLSFEAPKLRSFVETPLTSQPVKIPMVENPTPPEVARPVFKLGVQSEKVDTPKLQAQPPNAAAPAQPVVGDSAKLVGLQPKLEAPVSEPQEAPRKDTRRPEATEVPAFGMTSRVVASGAAVQAIEAISLEKTSRPKLEGPANEPAARGREDSKKEGGQNSGGGGSSQGDGGGQSGGQGGQNSGSGQNSGGGGGQSGRRQTPEAVAEVAEVERKSSLDRAHKAVAEVIPTAQVAMAGNQVVIRLHHESESDSPRIRSLRAEVAQLTGLPVRIEVQRPAPGAEEAELGPVRKPGQSTTRSLKSAESTFSVAGQVEESENKSTTTKSSSAQAAEQQAAAQQMARLATEREVHPQGMEHEVKDIKGVDEAQEAKGSSASRKGTEAEARREQMAQQQRFREQRNNKESQGSASSKYVTRLQSPEEVKKTSIGDEEGQKSCGQCGYPMRGSADTGCPICSSEQPDLMVRMLTQYRQNGEHWVTFADTLAVSDPARQSLSEKQAVHLQFVPKIPKLAQVLKLRQGQG